MRSDLPDKNANPALWLLDRNAERRRAYLGRLQRDGATLRAPMVDTITSVALLVYAVALGWLALVIWS